MESNISSRSKKLVDIVHQKIIDGQLADEIAVPVRPGPRVCPAAKPEPPKHDATYVHHTDDAPVVKKVEEWLQKNSDNFIAQASSNVSIFESDSSQIATGVSTVKRNLFRCDIEETATDIKISKGGGSTVRRNLFGSDVKGNATVTKLSKEGTVSFTSNALHGLQLLNNYSSSSSESGSALTSPPLAIQKNDLTIIGCLDADDGLTNDPNKLPAKTIPDNQPDVFSTGIKYLGCANEDGEITIDRKNLQSILLDDEPDYVFSADVPDSPVASVIEAFPVEEVTPELIVRQTGQKRGLQINDDEASPPKRRCKDSRKWKQTVAKEAFNLGLAHKSLRRKNIPGRAIREGCGATCKRKCANKVTLDQRKALFKTFWAIGNHARQWDFVARHVRMSPVKRRSKHVEEDETTTRNMSYSYFLLVDGVDVRVCQKMFIDTFDISIQFVKTAVAKVLHSGGAISPDKRGKYAKKSVVSTVITENVRQHIKKFPRVPGHYTRRDSKWAYLDENLNVRKMHSMYRIEREAEGLTRHTATLRQYRDVFRTYKIKFFQPKKDQCPWCLSFKYKTEEEKTEEVVQKHEEHRADRLRGRELKASDLQAAESDHSISVTTFDLQRVLMCPKGENGEFYYRSKLNSYNFTIFELRTKEALCYCWDQTVGKRGSNEIASFLFDFIKIKVEQGVKDFRFHSDNCYGQNKNRALFSMYHMACAKFGIKITHRYLEKGHTQMECDSIHACIERKAKKMEIFTPSQWYALIGSAKLSAPRYRVKEVTQDHIFNVKALADHFYWNKVPSSKIKEVVVDSAYPGYVSFKCKFDGPQKTVSILKNQRGKPVNWANYNLKRIYDGPIALRPNQLKDLRWLWKNGHIPPSSRSFYENLTKSPDVAANQNVPVGSTPNDNDESPDDISVSTGETENESEEEGGENKEDNDVELDEE